MVVGNVEQCQTRAEVAGEWGPAWFQHNHANKQKIPGQMTEDIFVVGPVGIEPTTHGLKVRCSNRLS